MSEPHTSRTALQKCVNVRACLRPYTGNFKCTFKYFQKIERPRALCEGQCWATARCSVNNHSGDGSSLIPMVPYILFVTARMDRPSTADHSQTYKIILTSWHALRYYTVGPSWTSCKDSHNTMWCAHALPLRTCHWEVYRNIAREEDGWLTIIVVSL